MQPSRSAPGLSKKRLAGATNVVHTDSQHQGKGSRSGSRVAAKALQGPRREPPPCLYLPFSLLSMRDEGGATRAAGERGAVAGKAIQHSGNSKK